MTDVGCIRPDPVPTSARATIETVECRSVGDMWEKYPVTLSQRGMNMGVQHGNNR